MVLALGFAVTRATDGIEAPLARDAVLAQWFCGARRRAGCFEKALLGGKLGKASLAGISGAHCTTRKGLLVVAVVVKTAFGLAKGVAQFEFGKRSGNFDGAFGVFQGAAGRFCLSRRATVVLVIELRTGIFEQSFRRRRSAGPYGTAIVAHRTECLGRHEYGAFGPNDGNHAFLAAA